MPNKILLIGLGGLGKAILNVMALNGPVAEIFVGSRSAEAGVEYCNLVRLAAASAGQFPRIEFLPLDLNQESEVAEIIARLAPDLVLTTATMMPWWVPDRLPPERAEIFQKAGFGVWLPIHLNLTVKLMRALGQVVYSGAVLTAPFPDVVNPVLAALGLAPTCGVGNLAEIVPKLRLLAAQKLGADVGKVHVSLVAHHSLEAYAFRAEADLAELDQKPPYHLEIVYQGREIGQELGADELLFSAYPIPPGQETHFLTAAAALSTIRALLSPTGTRIHVPGPLGLPGGYPVVASRLGLSLALPSGLTAEQAVEINSAAHRFDGVDRILPDGTVVFLPELADTMRATLGYDCEKLVPGEIEARAAELIGRFSDYAAEFGLRVR